MRLTKQVAKLEAAAERTIAVAAAPMGIVWTAHETRIDGGSLEVGEYIAVDMLLGVEVGGGLSAEDRAAGLGTGGGSVHEARLIERRTRRVDDLGEVYERGGVCVGRVTEINGSLLSWERLPAVVAAD